MSEPDSRTSGASSPDERAPAGAASPTGAPEGGASERTPRYDVPSRDEEAAALEEFAPDAEPADRAHRGTTPSPDLAASVSSATDAPLRPSSPRGTSLLLFGLLFAVASEGLFIGMGLSGQDRPRDTAVEGTIVLHSRPSGAQVLINGRSSGHTPLRVRVWPGAHVIQLQGTGGAVRRQRIRIAGGQTAWQYLELETRSPAPPPRSTVTAPSSTASAAGRLRPPATGRVRIRSEIPLLVFEGGRRIGSTDAGPLELRGGTHLLTLVNQRFGFRNAHLIQVAAGHTDEVAVALPKGLLAANATPWAEVFVSGRSLGETPIGEAMLPLGHYNVVFRHPELGERRVRVTIRADRPSIATVDFSD